MNIPNILLLSLAIGAPVNLPAFAAAFQCKAGDAMLRGGDQQVVIW